MRRAFLRTTAGRRAAADHSRPQPRLQRPGRSICTNWHTDPGPLLEIKGAAMPWRSSGGRSCASASTAAGANDRSNASRASIKPPSPASSAEHDQASRSSDWRRCSKPSVSPRSSSSPPGRPSRSATTTVAPRCVAARRPPCRCALPASEANPDYDIDATAVRNHAGMTRRRAASKSGATGLGAWLMARGVDGPLARSNPPGCCRSPKPP